MSMYSHRNSVAGQAVHVRAYTRFRYGKLEWVVSHYRSWPNS